MPATVDLSEFDVVLINSSAGKDSLAMLDAVTAQAEAQGVTDRIVVVHADLGRAEWNGTDALAARQAARYGHRFEIVTRTDGADLLDLIERRGMWPSAKARYCTSDTKRACIRRLMTRLATEHRDRGGAAPCRILNCMGLRAAESSARAKKIPVEVDRSASTKTTRTVTNWLPILEWSDTDVWDHIIGNNLEYHPAYDIDGVRRLSCVLCVLADEAQLRAGIAANPDLARTYAALEERMGHTFKANMAIADLVADVLDQPVALTAGASQ